MGQITLTYTFSPNSTIASAQMNTNLATDIVTVYNAHDIADTGVHNVGSGAIVGTTLTQTLTNKTLTSPTITGPAISGTVSGGATYSAPTITGPTISGTVSGGATYSNITLSGTIAGTPTFSGAISLGSTLSVTGAVTLSSTLGVTGATTLSSTLGVTGATTLSSTLGVTGAATLSSTLGVTGATTFGSTITVSSGNIRIASTGSLVLGAGSTSSITESSSNVVDFLSNTTTNCIRLTGSNGFVRIGGEGTAGSALHVNKTSAGNAIARFRNGDSGTGTYIYLEKSDGSDTATFGRNASDELYFKATSSGYAGAFDSTGRMYVDSLEFTSASMSGYITLTETTAGFKGIAAGGPLKPYFETDGVGGWLFTMTPNGAGVSTRGVQFSYSEVIPSHNNWLDLGSAAYAWKNVYGVNAYTTTSDERAKKDIQTTDLGLDFIKMINPVKYKWKDTENDNFFHYGFIAQDLLTHLSDKNTIVTHDEASDKYNIRATELMSPMVKAIQQLSEKIEILENKVG